jgi:hypothetical protein
MNYRNPFFSYEKSVPLSHNALSVKNDQIGQARCGAAVLTWVREYPLNSYFFDGFSDVTAEEWH